MATIDDLSIPSITDESVNEAIERLRKIRLSRRIPAKKPPSTKKKQAKAIPKLSSQQAANLLKELEGK